MLMQDNQSGQPSAVSPLEQAVKRYEEQANKLNDVIERLDMRLACVSSSKPQAPCNAKDQTRPQLAPIIQVVDGMADKIACYRARIEGMMERLDI